MFEILELIRQKDAEEEEGVREAERIRSNQDGEGIEGRMRKIMRAY